jgi:type IV pilus assembly protein PilC
MRLKTLATFCKSLATMLHAGVALLKALETLARKTGDATCRARIAEVREAVQAGTEISQALRDSRGYFPELMIDMVQVGEHSGALPEVLDGLADHYENMLRLRRNFLTAITWPMIQLVAAILVVALLIFILGIIGETQRGPAVDPLGWGLTGASGAIRWLLMTFGSMAMIGAAYHVGANVFRQKRAIDSLIMKIPVVGNCLRSFAVARFSWAFAMSQQTGMSITRSLDLSFRVTGNGAFIGASPEVCQAVQAGDELATALAASRLFPEEFLQIVEVAEASGTVPEALKRLSPQLEDQARRALATLAAALSWLIWLAVAILIIFIIISIFMRVYIGPLNEQLRQLEKI